VENAYATHTGNNLKVIGSFGYLEYNNIRYAASELTFFRKSEHSFGPRESHLDMEMQIFHRSSQGQLLVVAVNYRLNDTNSMFMDQLNFGQVSGMQSGDSRPVRNAVDVGLVFNNVTQLIMYQGSLTAPPCSAQVTYLILGNLKRITETFLDAFPTDLINMRRETHDRGNIDLVLMNYQNGAQFNNRTLSSNIDTSSGDRTTHTNGTVQGFRIASDINLDISRDSPYPIVADINTHLPFTQARSSPPASPPASSISASPSNEETAQTTNSPGISSSTIQTPIQISSGEDEVASQRSTSSQTSAGSEATAAIDSSINLVAPDSSPAANSESSTSQDDSRRPTATSSPSSNEGEESSSTRSAASSENSESSASSRSEQTNTADSGTTSASEVTRESDSPVTSAESSDSEPQSTTPEERHSPSASSIEESEPSTEQPENSSGDISESSPSGSTAPSQSQEEVASEPAEPVPTTSRRDQREQELRLRIQQEESDSMHAVMDRRESEWLEDADELSLINM